MSFKDDTIKEVIEMKKEVQDVKEQSLALELIKDARQTNKRLFVIIIIILVLWFASIGLFIYYINTTGYEVTTESTEVENDSGNANACVGDNCNNGEINYGKSKGN